MAVREEMWAQAARDRDALEAELSLRHEAERSRFLEEAGERDSEIVEEVRALLLLLSCSSYASLARLRGLAQRC